MPRTLGTVAQVLQRCVLGLYGMKRIEAMSLWERAYFPEIFRGLMLTGFRFWRNLTVHALHCARLTQRLQAAITVQYPDQRAPYPDTFRGRHRLTLKDDGAVQCTACYFVRYGLSCGMYLHRSRRVCRQIRRKFSCALRDRHSLRCIYCGFCVEACPCDAIRMDSELIPAIWD